jgi:hypothetical protein
MKPALEELADDAAFAVSDLLDDADWEWFEELGPVERIQWRYCHADCDDFAAVLSLITGWPVVCFESRTKGPVHRAVQAPDGRYLDAMGWSDIETLRVRYRMRGLRCARSTNAFSPLLDDDEDIARILCTISHLGVEPFNSPYFESLVSSFVR